MARRKTPRRQRADRLAERNAALFFDRILRVERQRIRHDPLAGHFHRPVELYAGREGKNYTVVFRGGFRQNDPREYTTESFRLADNLRLSMRARAAEIVETDRTGVIVGRMPNPFGDKRQITEFDDSIFQYLGHSVRMRVFVELRKQEYPYERIPYVLTSPRFTLGDLNDFYHVYLSGVRTLLEKLGKRDSKNPIYTTSIWIAYSEEAIPGKAIHAKPRKERLSSITKSGRGATRTSGGSVKSRKRSAGRSRLTGHYRQLSRGKVRKSSTKGRAK